MEARMYGDLAGALGRNLACPPTSQGSQWVALVLGDGTRWGLLFP